MPCPERFKTIGGAGMHGPEGIGGTGIIDYRDAAFIKPGFGPDWAQQRKAPGTDLDCAFRAVGDSRIRLWDLDEGGHAFSAWR